MARSAVRLGLELEGEGHAELAAGGGLLELELADRGDDAADQLLVRDAVRGGADDVAVGADLEAGDDLAGERRGLAQARRVALADLGAVVADVVADGLALVALRQRRRLLLARLVGLDGQR